MGKVDWNTISSAEAKYRLELKREITKKGILRESIRDFTTEDLEDLKSKIC